MKLKWMSPVMALVIAPVLAAPVWAQQDTLTRAQVTALRARYPQQQEWEVSIRSGTRLDSLRQLYDRRLQVIAVATDTLDQSPYPLWYRAYLRDAYPDLPTTGAYQYPRVAAQLLEWMVRNQDFEVPPAGMPGSSTPIGESRTATVGNNVNMTNRDEVNSESSIAVDPGDASHLVASSNNITGSGRLKQFYSSDGGVSWNTTELPLDDGAAFHSDPAVAWSSDGTAWSATLGISPAGAIKVQMYKSTDRGATWTFEGTVSTGTDNDKELIWVDNHPSSPHKDNIYVAWDQPGRGIRFVRSTDNGATWSSVTSLSSDGAIGTHLTTGPSGELYVAWPDVNSRQIKVRKSTDGGATFGSVTVIATTNDAYEVSVPAMCRRKVLIYVTVAVDRSSGPNSGNVYALWNDRNGSAADPGCSGVTAASNSNVYFSRSVDGGSTWSTAAVVHSDPPQSDQFNPWMDVDPATGGIHVAYYDTRDDSDRRTTRLYYVHSEDGGATWIDETQVATAPTDESVSAADANQYGDYNGLAAFEVVHPSWTDRRSGVPGGSEQIFTARIGASSETTTVLTLELDPDVKLSVGETTTARATLTRDGSPLEGETVLFTAGDTDIASVSSPSASTNASGVAEVTVTGEGRGRTTITASGGGDLKMVTVRVPSLSLVLLLAVTVVIVVVAVIRLRHTVAHA
jgi:hypothetical protein